MIDRIGELGCQDLLIDLGFRFRPGDEQKMLSILLEKSIEEDESDDAEDSGGKRVHLVPAATLEKMNRRIASAKRCVYRGGGQLLVVPWKVELNGLWLVIDFFSGLAGLLYALSIASVNFVAICLESDPILVESIRANFPDAIILNDAKDFSCEWLADFVKKRNPKGILLGGGHPCQPNSTMNVNSAEMKDPRAALGDIVPVAAINIEKKFPDVQVLVFSEQPVGRCIFRDRSDAAYGKPIGIQADIYGHVHRGRLFHGYGPADLLEG